MKIGDLVAVVNGTHTGAVGTIASSCTCTLQRLCTAIHLGCELWQVRLDRVTCIPEVWLKKIDGRPAPAERAPDRRREVA